LKYTTEYRHYYAIITIVCRQIINNIAEYTIQAQLSNTSWPEVTRINQKLCQPILNQPTGTAHIQQCDMQPVTGLRESLHICIFMPTW